MLVVTGATGLLGNVLLRGLTARGAAPVRALVRPSSDLTAIAGLDVETVPGDVRDPASLLAAFAGADVVFHLAGIVSIERGGLPRLHETNVEGTRNVLAACREAGVRRLVYCSSIHAFVVPQRRRLPDRDEPYRPGPCARGLRPDEGRGDASWCSRRSEQGLDAVMVFPTGVIGPYDFRPSHTGELVLAAAQGRLGAYVDGAYNFVDVRDVAQGLLAAAEIGRSGEGYILAGHNVTVRELLRFDRGRHRDARASPAPAVRARPRRELPHPRLLLGHQAETAVHHLLTRRHLLGLHDDQREGRAGAGIPSPPLRRDDGGYGALVQEAAKML